MNNNRSISNKSIFGEYKKLRDEDKEPHTFFRLGKEIALDHEGSILILTHLFRDRDILRWIDC